MYGMPAGSNSAAFLQLEGSLDKPVSPELRCRRRRREAQAHTISFRSKNATGSFTFDAALSRLLSPRLGSSHESQ